MRALPLYLEERLYGARAAILAREESAGFEVARLCERMVSEKADDIRVFTDRERAMHWLLPERPAV